MVFELLSTPERLPEWNVSIERACRLIAAEPIGLGSRAICSGRLLGQTVESETEVIGFEPLALQRLTPGKSEGLVVVRSHRLGLVRLAAGVRRLGYDLLRRFRRFLLRSRRHARVAGRVLGR